MYEYTSYDSISIKVGQNAKENDQLTMTSNPREWWMHVLGYPGSHVVICYDGETVPKETKRDAAVLAVHHSKAPNAKMTHVDFIRLDQVSKYTNTSHGQVSIEGKLSTLVVFMNKEKPRLDRLLKNRHNK